MSSKKSPELPAPEGFTDAQRGAWTEAAALLPPGPTELVRQTLEAYSVERARWIEAESMIRDQGSTLVLRTDKGAVRQVIENPQIKIAQRSQDRALKLATQLGLGAKRGGMG